MSESIDKLSNLFDKLKSYLTLQLNFVLLNAGEKAATLLAKLVENIVMIFLSIFVFLFLSLAGAFALGAWLKSTALGFLLVGAFYFLIIIIIVLSKHKFIEKPLVNVFIKLFFSNDSEEDKSNE